MLGKARRSDIPTAPTRFEFVTGHSSQHQIRQHVAKINWKRRRIQKALPQRSGTVYYRPIASIPVQNGALNRSNQHPEKGTAKEDCNQHDEHEDHYEHEYFTSLNTEDPINPLESPETCTGTGKLCVDLKHTLVLMSPSRMWKLETVPSHTDNLIIAYQLLNGMEIDPFNSTILLSRDDQILLRHWVNEYALKAFGQPTDPEFNPLGNVHVPINLSHKASVHGILAHAASHIACLRGERTSAEALGHKMAAIHLVNRALANDETAVSDDNITAVLRLLTYERYWGTEEVWQLHRRGLNDMVKRRGGLSTLSNDWQLETQIHLVVLMQRPRWKSAAFSTAHLPPDEQELIFNSDQLHSDFTNFFSDINSVTPDIAQAYPAINRATNFLHSLVRSSEIVAAPVLADSQEIARLMCLFYIATIVKGANRSHFNLLWLNDSLERTEQVWNNSVEILRWLLLQGVGRGKGGLHDIERTEKLKEIALLLNKSSYKDIEDRLLHVLVDGPNEDPFLPCE